MSTPVLETIGLVKRFGGLLATDHVSFTLRRGARHALIGPNGAGKTTFVNQLTGVLTPTEGQIRLEGEDITHRRPEARVRLGMSRTFQINQLFRTMTPLEMLLLVLGEREGRGLHFWSRLDARADLVREAATIAERFRLDDVIDATIATLSYGKQRQLEIAAAFAARPKVLLLDEPAAGVPEAERQDLLDTVAELPEDVSVLLIEHDMDLVFRFATRITVLVNGAVIADGEPAAIAADPAVRAAYLGEGKDA
ncbi:ABC transporter ATP-binding protein [Ancylobacter defluvii]|uniref:ABC transporter ATP-binding protein n=1 Tax=Ancylobacter defluvii TaxID=1282440 RepID=A0A9W6K295_9HYPH|nr:ABC transporter ATP-binding protein [Ancylobacter defluvii]MBS7586347.1 ABC transporter ATP-binding protein [Ancylobacter defluvii]GLK85628.1 ABC transporter ATP-binding protein [Ancylobacter defluvii]